MSRKEANGQWSTTRWVLSALGSGALLAYLFDPDNGRRRRAIMRDKIYSKVHDIGDAANLIATDTANRARGAAAAGLQRVRRREIPNRVLVERVRSRLGRVVSHPGALHVTAAGGAVTISGPILKHEAKHALDAVASVSGVQNVVDRLEQHEQPGKISSLQGGKPREMRSELMQENWAPATRFLVGLTGAGLVSYCWRRRPIGSLLYSTAGWLILARAIANKPLKQLAGMRGRRSIEFTKNIHIDAPVHTVYEFWNNFENFPKFMRNVRSVQKRGDNTWHWEVVGPLGASVTWDARVTERIPNEVLAWSTVPGAAIQQAGIVKFQSQNTGTRVELRIAYNPLIGAPGHVVASLFGANPKREIDEDLLRVKSYLETGKPARDATQHRHMSPTETSTRPH